MFLLKKKNKTTTIRNETCIEACIKILHLGDLHAQEEEPDKEMKTKLFEYLVKEVQVFPFDLAVFCGDLIHKADKKEAKLEAKLEKAKSFINDLTDKISLGSEKVVLVPGWHDVISEEPYFGAFLQLSNEFYDKIFPPIGIEAPSAYLFRRYAIGRLWGCFPTIALGLNSCDPFDKKGYGDKMRKEYRHGSISETQVESAILTVGPEELTNSFVILVFHHTPWPETAAEGTSAAEQGAQLIQSVKKLRPSLCLTGHWHYNLKPRELADTFFCSAGSILCTKDLASNQFNIIELSVFAHQKDVFSLKQRAIRWREKEKDWHEMEEPEYLFTSRVTDRIKKYVGVQK